MVAPVALFVVAGSVTAAPSIVKHTLDGDLARRQLSEFGGGKNGGGNPLVNLIGSFFSKPVPAKPFSVKDVSPQLDPAANRQIVRYGPYKLGPANGKRTGFAFDPSGDAFSGPIEGLCKDCMILSGATYLTYENGSRADVDSGVYNHHVAFSAMGRQSRTPFRCGFAKRPTALQSTPTSNGRPVPNTVTVLEGLQNLIPESMRHESREPPVQQASMMFGSADDGVPILYGSKDPSLKAGFYLGPNHNVSFFSEYINYKNYSQEVYMTVDIEYIQGKPPGYLDASMGTISALGCGFAYIPPSNGPHTVSSPEYEVLVPGTLYNMRGHLHDGGVNVRVHVNGKLQCESKAIYSADKGTAVVDGQKWESIRDYTYCYNAIPLQKGDKIVVDSTYDLSVHKLRPGTSSHSMGGEAMGLMAYSYAIDPPK